MKKIRWAIAGAGFLIAGSVGFAILEVARVIITVSPGASTLGNGVLYYLLIIFLFVGIILLIASLIGE